MRFIRKEPLTKCGKIVYQTNYKGILLSKEHVNEAKKIDKIDIKNTNYMNNKMDFLFHILQNSIKDVYQEMIINDCRLNREILRNRFAMVISNPSLVAPMLLSE